MIAEFCRGQQRTFRLRRSAELAQEPKSAITVVGEVHAADHFRKLAEDGQEASATTPPTTTTTSSSSSSRLALSPQRIRRWLEVVFLPDGYPNSVTDDLLTVACWDMAQLLCSNATATLSTRAILLGAGVGTATANVSSSTVSYLIRDGVRLISSLCFATFASADLAHRCKSWRVVADVCNDAALLLEIISPWFSGWLTFALVLMACVLRSIVAVAGNATRLSFVESFARVGNSADIAAKTSNRDNVGSLFGLGVGMIVAHVTPAHSLMATLAVFAIFTVLHAYCNHRSIRALILRQLNAPRLEWCLAAFMADEAQRRAHAKKQDPPPSSSTHIITSTTINMSPALAAREETLLILPALPPSLSKRDADAMPWSERLTRRLSSWLPNMKVRLCCGASLHDVLDQRMLSISSPVARHQLILDVEGALSTNGVALLYDVVMQSYHLIFPEPFTPAGDPQSWMPYKRQEERMRQRLRLDGSGNRTSMVVDGEDLSSTDHNAAHEAERERLHTRRQLWGYFYAYVHQAALVRGGDGGVAEVPSIYLITALQEDGQRPRGKHTCAPRSFGLEEGSKEWEEATRLCREGEDADALYPDYLRFVATLERQGWQLSRLLLPDEGHTVAIHML